MARSVKARGRGRESASGASRSGADIACKSPQVIFSLYPNAFCREEIEKRETQLRKIEKQLADRQQRFGDPAVASNSAKLKQLTESRQAKDPRFHAHRELLKRLDVRLSSANIGAHDQSCEEK
jgi:hypothetical protein